MALAARFAGYCSRCGEDILPGQRVVKHRWNFIHACCASGADD